MSKRPYSAGAEQEDSAQCRDRLKDERDWRDPKLLPVLQHLHQQAENDPSGPWAETERALFGDPGRLIKKSSVEDDNDGPGISASLMNGPQVDMVTLSGLPLSDYALDRLQDAINWMDFVQEADGDLIEQGEFDEYPGTSDVFYWLRVPDPYAFARRLRESVVKNIHKNGRK